MLIRDEDLFVERAIRNALPFCDEFLVADHQSCDGTVAILQRLQEEFPGKLKVRRISHPRESHEWIRPYANTETWIFGVDGDEIYDPVGLRLLRDSLESGVFSRYWCVFGHVLNVRDLDLSRRIARGHATPPCRSMTKLYNFAAIQDWGGDCVERLHGGEIRFHEGFGDLVRCSLQEQTSWEESLFRCLHLCFLQRSSLENNSAPRKNIMDRHAWSLPKFIAKLRGFILRQSTPDWKEQRYGRGPLVEKSVDTFFPAN